MEFNLTPEYVAGFFDGEGSIGIYPRSWNRNHTIRYYVLVVSLGQSGEKGKLLLEELATVFGGCVYQNTGGSKNKIMWKWNIAANKAKTFLTWMLPYLYIKKEEALHGLTFQDLDYKVVSSIEATELYKLVKECKLGV